MSGNLRGILAVLIASTAFVGHDTTVKLLTAELPPSEIIIVRGLIATPMFLVGVLVGRATRPLAVLLMPLMLLRLVSAAGAAVFIIFALRHLPLATATSVLQATPLLATAGAAVFYGDVVGWRRWAAILTGFLGVVLIVRPGGDFSAAAYLVLLALLCTTTRDISTRGLPKTIPSILVAAASTVISTLAGLLILPFDTAWSMPSSWAWWAMTASAFCLLTATTLMVTGLRSGEIAVVAPFRYVPVPLSLLLGWWFWGDVPDAVAIIGIALVLGAGLYTLHRERAGLRAPPAPIAAHRSAAE
jgi:drug/metabolite transporter (DMT)-like permease